MFARPRSRAPGRSIPIALLMATSGLGAQGPGDGVRTLTLEELRTAAQEGLSALELVRRDLPEVRFRQGARDEEAQCIEYGERATGGECRNLEVVVDRVLVTEPLDVLRFMDLARVGRLTLLSPAEALARYGNFGGEGVILIETLAERPAEIEIRDEQPWPRVLASTFVTNALAVGLTYLPVSYCTHVWDGSLQIRELREPGQLRHGIRCHEALAIGAGALALGVPGPLSGLVARRMGTTPESRGTLVSVTIGTLAHFAGHLLFFQGRANDSGALTAIGAGTLLIGTPLAVTLVDRFSRTPR